MQRAHSEVTEGPFFTVTVADVYQQMSCVPTEADMGLSPAVHSPSGAALAMRSVLYEDEGQRICAQVTPWWKAFNFQLYFMPDCVLTVHII